MAGNIGKNIKNKLFEKNLTAKALAEYAGVSECYISRLCNGDRGFGKVSAEAAIRMADLLGCSVYELISPPADDVANGNAKYGLY
jgi:transcriptional regulator with XRE-family HTH domain